MKKILTRAAVITATSLAAAALLTGCAGEKHTFNGLEVSSLDKAIEALDASWSQHRANGKAATVDDSSHCFVQTGKDGVLADKALCGPVHYLGDDDTIWESVPLQPTPDGKDKVTLGSSTSFSKDQPNANTTLFRTDGKKAAENASLAEPDTKAATLEQAIWGNVKDGGTTVTVRTPDGSFDISGAKVTDRIGGAENRLKAGDGNKFGTSTVTFHPAAAGSNGLYSSVADPAVKTTLAYVSGGKTYPIGTAKTGLVSMAVPGDGSDLALAVTYDGMTQTVSLADSKLHTTATAYYDGVADKAIGTKPEPLTIGDHTKIGLFAEFFSDGASATRTAYDAKNGWAPEGKAWLVVSSTARVNNTSNLSPSVSFPGGNAQSYYDAALTVTGGNVANISGTKFSAAAKSMDIDKSTVSGGSFNSSASFKLVFEVPASATDFTVDYNVHAAGKLQRNMDKGAPATTEMDYPVKGVQLTFTKK